MRRVLLALLVVSITPAHADEALRQREALRARLLGHQLPLAAPEGDGRRRPDDAGAYDLIDLRVEMEVPRGRLPDRLFFELRVRAVQPIDGALPLYAVYFVPDAVRTAEGRVLQFDRDDDGLLLIGLDRQLAPGQELVLHIDADFAHPCADPVGCIEAGDFRHLADLGWYPLSAEFPLSDRFQVTLDFLVNDAVIPAATGARERPVREGQFLRWRYRTERPTILPAFAVAPFVLDDRDPFVELFGPPFSADGGASLHGVARSVLDLYPQIFGDYPFSRLGLAAISDESQIGGIGPQANILLPNVLWQIPPDAREFSVVEEVVAHEIGHQYFFNLVGVVDAREGWLSEAFAEYAATRFTEWSRGTLHHARTNYWSYVLGVGQGDDVALTSEALTGANPYRFQILYQKGSWVVRMIHQRLAQQLGPFGADGILRAYVTEFAGQIASTAELRHFLTRATGIDFAPFFTRWVDQAGFPTLIVRVEPARREADDPLRFDIEQGPNRHGQFTGALPIRLHRPDGTTADVEAGLSVGTYALPVGPVTWMEVDPDLWIFRRVRPDPAGDVNLNGVVDGMDLLDVHAAMGRQTPDPDWDDRVDVNDDQVIDDRDLAALARQFGAGW